MKVLFAATVALAVLPAWAQAPAAAKKADPKIHECREHNQKVHAEVVKIHADAKKAGNISKAEEAKYHRMEQNLQRHRATLSRGGLTLDECHKLSREIEHEKAEVQKMAASPAKKK